MNSFESGNEDQKKALFLVGVPVVHLAADIVGEIIKASSFEYVQIVSTASPTVHNWARFPGREVGERHTIEELETQVRKQKKCNSFLTNFLSSWR